MTSQHAKERERERERESCSYSGEHGFHTNARSDADKQAAVKSFGDTAWIKQMKTVQLNTSELLMGTCRQGQTEPGQSTTQINKAGRKIFKNQENLESSSKQLSITIMMPEFRHLLQSAPLVTQLFFLRLTAVLSRKYFLNLVFIIQSLHPLPVLNERFRWQKPPLHSVALVEFGWDNCVKNA